MFNTFSLLTLNCFGLWLPGTQQRLWTLARELEKSSYQVVCLQEIQLHQYQQLLVRECPSYPYACHERYVHCPKGGLLTLSRIPILTKSFQPYQERGLWYTPMLLDRLFYKGMLITELSWESIPVTIINTHILANFAGDWKRHGMYARVEEKQLRELAETVRKQSTDSLIVVVGDFNIPRGSSLYYDFIDQSGLTDPLAGDGRPTLRTLFKVPFQDTLSIDYALFRLPKEGGLKVNCDLHFVEKYPVRKSQYSYLSDHYGIEMQITANKI
jgi:endonuclease/exonuclease/phosphatase family metal-dependent hydrolase